MHGCTSPFGSNKEKICNDFDNATKVNDMYKKWYSNQIQAKSGCNKPCSYVTLRTNTVWVRKKKFKTTDKTKVKVVIYFKENIKVTKAYHVYSGLTLIAEIGGYVGLFLGVSINQLTNLFHVIVQHMRSY